MHLFYNKITILKSNIFAIHKTVCVCESFIINAMSNFICAVKEITAALTKNEFILNLHKRNILFQQL